MTTQYIEVDAYARNSDLKQVDSQETQATTLQHACDTLIPQLFGGKVGRLKPVYKDEGKSASKKKSVRPDYQRLMRDIEDGRVKVLLIVNTSRLSRLHPMDTLQIYNTIRTHGVTLVSIDDRKIVSTDEIAGIVEMVVKSSNDHEYARSLAKNTLRGGIRKVQKGQPRCAVAPYGLQKLYLDEAGREHRYPRGQRSSKAKGWASYLVRGDETEAKIIEWLFTTYATRDISYNGLSTKLNQHDNPIVRGGPNGNGWCGETIRHILSNPHYAGQSFFGLRPCGEHYRTHEGDIIETKKQHAPSPVYGTIPYPSLVKLNLFQQVQEKMVRQQERNAKPQSQGDREGYPLTGCLICGNCGHGLFGMKNAGNPRYQCRSAQRSKQHDCGCWSVREDELLPYMLHAIDRELLKKLDDQPDTTPDDSAQLNLAKRIADIDQRITTIKTNMATATPDTINILASVVSSLTEERRTAQTAIRSTDHGERARAAYDAWEAITEPILIPIKTGTLADENGDLLDDLGIRDEVANLFDYTLARPSAVRSLLHSLNTRVECWFRQDGGGDKRKSYKLDKARLTAEIGGNPITTIGSGACKPWS